MYDKNIASFRGMAVWPSVTSQERVLCETLVCGLVYKICPSEWMDTFHRRRSLHRLSILGYFSIRSALLFHCEIHTGKFTVIASEADSSNSTYDSDSADVDDLVKAGARWESVWKLQLERDVIVRLLVLLSRFICWLGKSDQSLSKFNLPVQMLKIRTVNPCSIFRHRTLPWVQQEQLPSFCDQELPNWRDPTTEGGLRNHWQAPPFNNDVTTLDSEANVLHRSYWFRFLTGCKTAGRTLQRSTATPKGRIIHSSTVN
jgi:hypothetical protein